MKAMSLLTQRLEGAPKRTNIAQTPILDDGKQLNSAAATLDVLAMPQGSLLTLLLVLLQPLLSMRQKQQ
jgi:hypothetical protein